MVMKKAGKKELKKLKKRALKAEEKVNKLQKKIVQLDKKLAKRNARIKDLTRQSTGKAPEAPDSSETPSLDSIRKSVSTDLSRDALRRAVFLRDRYEHHLRLSKPKDLARREANQDLIGNYGPETGFTDQELEDVLS